MPGVYFLVSVIFYFLCCLIEASLQNTVDIVHSSRTFSNETICQLPTFLQTVLGVNCSSSGNSTQQNGAHFLFAVDSPPVWTPREPNGTCPSGRFEWNSSNSSLCCLELACPPGQVLAKDQRNTLDGECPKCKNVVFEYRCDPVNDTCDSLQKGTVCRKFFNSTSLHVCACDSERGYTQNRMAFPVSCTKTVGAVCFLQEHCKFVDPNARCIFDDGPIHSPRGACGCKNGTREDHQGRCIEDKILKTPGHQPDEPAQIRKVRQTAVADWGDKSLWVDGPIKNYPYYDLSTLRKTPKFSSVFHQTYPDDESIKSNNERSARANTLNITVSNFTSTSIANITSATTPTTTVKTTIRIVNSSASSPDPVNSNSTLGSSSNTTNRPTPASYMIAAQHIANNVPKHAVATAVSGKVPVAQDKSIAAPQHFDSSQAVSGTKIIPAATEKEDDVQVDDILNIVRPIGTRKRVDRPDTTGRPVTTTNSISATGSSGPTTTIVPYWEGMSSTLPSSVLRSGDASTTRSVPSISSSSTVKTVRRTFAPAIRFTKQSPLPDIKIIQVQHDDESQDNDTLSTTVADEDLTSTTSRTPSSTTQTNLSTTTATTSTTPVTTPTTTPKSTTIRAATTKQTIASATTTKTTTTTPITKTTSMTTASRVESGTSVSDWDSESVSINGSGVVKVKLNEIPRRFGGGVRAPTHSVIGGVNRAPAVAWSDSSTSAVQWSAASTSPTTTVLSTTMTSKATPVDYGVDFSFLQDSSLSKAAMQERLIQALLELSATTTPTTTTTTTTPTTTTTTPTTSTTPKPSVDLSFLMNSRLSPEELQKRLLPLLMQLNEELRNKTTTSPTSTARSVPTSALTTSTSTRTSTVRSTTPSDVTYASVKPGRRKNVSLFGGLFNSLANFGSRRSRPHSKTNSIEDPNGDLDDQTSAPTTKSTTTTTPTTSTTAGKRRHPVGPSAVTASPSKSGSNQVAESNASVPGFSDILTGLGALVGSVLGGRPSRPDSSNPLAGLKTVGGKVDMSDPKVQQQVAKFMQQASPKGGVSSSNGKFDLRDPNDQEEFVKFLSNFDKYQPSSSQQNGEQSSLFPRPPPGSQGSSPPDTEPDFPTFVQPEQPTTTTTTTSKPTGPVPIAIPVDDLSPEALAILKQMQKPGYYNLTKEQIELIQPVLKEIRDRAAQQSQPAPDVPPPTTSKPFRERPGLLNMQFSGTADGDPWAGNAGSRPVPPVFPVPLEILPPPSTTPTTTTTTTTAARPVAEGKMMAPLSDTRIQYVQPAPSVKQPQQPPFSAVLPSQDCPADCQYQDSFSTCDTKIGACVCQPGYRSSLLMGNGCTKTLFSLCSADEDCRSGGDANAECSFNGQNRFCTCSNGYLADSNGVCKPMFTERCTSVCNIPNAVCDQTRGVCRCPTGYAWYRDPWTGQAVCRAAVGGNVPCRSDQDLCPIYTPRGKCRNNAFCGCDDGYIPDSWFTNRSERTNCIDVLSAKCDDNSDCTAGDRNTICDRRLRMCVCKAGFKPDPFHSAACVPSF